jgi:hypothetical protein
MLIASVHCHNEGNRAVTINGRVLSWRYRYGNVTRICITRQTDSRAAAGISDG